MSGFNDAILNLEKTFIKCDRCGKKLQHWIKNTQAVWCKFCSGKFCLKCWIEHRQEEYKSGKVDPENF